MLSVLPLPLTAWLGKAGAVAGLALFFMLSLACNGEPGSPETADARLQVGVSTPILADIARNLTGSRADVWSVIPAGSDPHSYSATPKDIARLSETDLLILVGANLERFIEAAAWRRAAREAGTPVLELAAGLPLIKVDRIVDHGDHVHDLRDGDPHVWMDPIMVIGIVELIAAKLGEIDAAGREAYLANARVYHGELRRLHEEVSTQLRVVPDHLRKLVVSHDSYSYFAKRYGFEVIGYVTGPDSAEPSPRDLADLRRIVSEAGVPAAFKEPGQQAKHLDVVASDAGIKVAGLIGDTFPMGVTTYVDLIRFNARSIVDHLGD